MPIYCGGHLLLKSDAYVSDVRIVIQVNRLKTLTCYMQFCNIAAYVSSAKVV